jgi:imidazole glycerol-phosphate synthase subunit HisH
MALRAVATAVPLRSFPFRIATLAGLGVGNVRSVVRALESTVSRSKEIIATADPDVLNRADVLVVPGQGSFGAFADALSRDGGALRQVLSERIVAGTPYFGICLGLQILFNDSEESPGTEGLGLLSGRVRRLTPGSDLPLPHIGWNNVSALRVPNANVSPIAGDDYFYFAHTFAVPQTSYTIASTDYGSDSFTCAVRRGNVVGVQFHPEKSQRAGLSLLQRFFETIVT